MFKFFKETTEEPFNGNKNVAPFHNSANMNLIKKNSSPNVETTFKRRQMNVFAAQMLLK